MLEQMVPERSADAAKQRFDHLFAYVFEVLCQAGRKTLNPQLLSEKLSSLDVSSEYLAATRSINLRLEELEKRIAALETTVNRHETEIAAHGEALKTFYRLEEFFSIAMPGKGVHDFDQQLRGRKSFRDELDLFLDDPNRRIAVLPGSGGMGKTKLLRDWTQGQVEWTTLWTSRNVGVWHTGTPNEILPTDTIIVVDDAHRYDDLERVLTLVATWNRPNRLKLVIAVRRSDTSYLQQTLAKVMDTSGVAHLPALMPLTHDEVVALATEVLGTEHSEHALRLAKASHDNPFLTVAGGLLIKQGRATPELLNNDDEFRHRVLDNLASQFEGPLPAGGRSKREFMEFIAALQPIEEGNERHHRGWRLPQFEDLRNQARPYLSRQRRCVDAAAGQSRLSSPICWPITCWRLPHSRATVIQPNLPMRFSNDSISLISPTC